MKRRLAIIGLGKLGKACGEAIVATENLAVAGIVRRPESLSQPLPAALGGVAVAPHASELDRFDPALICLPTAVALKAATDLLQHRIPIVEAATVPSATYQSYKREVDRVALRHKVAAVIGARLGAGDAVSVPPSVRGAMPQGPQRYARSARRQFAPYPRRALGFGCYN
jgi:diaminopimelate dehydrogenase